MTPAALFLASLLALPADGAPAEPVRRSLEGFGESGVVEVLDLSRARAIAAIRDAAAAVHRTELLLDPQGSEPGGIGRLNRTTGGELQGLDADAGALLRRAEGFCVWSQGAYGPLGGALHEIWGVHRPVAAAPAPEALTAALATAACDRLYLDPERPQARLAAGSRIDLHGFALGWAVDRAVDGLQAAGARNGFVTLAGVTRAFGPGRDGRGWGVEVVIPEIQDHPFDRLFLKDRSLATAVGDRRPLRIGGEAAGPPYIDQRTGQPASGTRAVLVVTELAVDAQGMASTLFILGTREGQFRLGPVRPAPAVLWLIGDHPGPPVMVEHRWQGISR